MVIATKPKPRESTHHKKRTGKHQPQTKHFMKAYWPYLPMVGVTAAVNALLGASEVASTHATRLQTWGANQALVLSVLSVTALLAVYLVSKHALAWQRAFTKGERFFVHHHKVDLVLAAIMMTGVVVTRMA